MNVWSEVPAKIPFDGKMFFMAVSKTAGNSVSSYLSSLFRPEDVCPGPTAGIWTYSPSDVAQYRLFQGHFDHDFINGFEGTKIKLIILRDPCARLVSLYDFWRSYSWNFITTKLPPLPTNGPAVAKSCSFVEFLTTDNTFVQKHVSNPAARQLLGAEFGTISKDQNRAIEKCVRHLETFAWVGIAEDFQTSIRMLAARLGSPVPSGEIRLNRTYNADSLGPDRELVNRTEVSRDELILMRELSTLDLMIYEEARRLFRERCSKVQENGS